MEQNIASWHQLLNTKLSKRMLLLCGAIAVYYLFSYLQDPYAEYWKSYFQQSNSYIIGDILFSIIFCAMLCELCLFIDKRLNVYVPWTVKPLSRLILQAFFHLASCVLVILLVYKVFEIIYYKNNASTLLTEKEITYLFQWFATSIFISIMISTANTGNYLLKSWKQTAIEAAEHKIKAAEHKQATTEAELQALKLQLDPHFVFNSLSVLSELILEDQQLGYEYSENFAKVYRYLLVNSKKDLISSEEELKFLHAYLFLVKKRIGDGVLFEINIDTSMLHLKLPPLTLQLFIENALKHNQTTKTNPLLIRIYSDTNEYLVVENILIPLLNKPFSAGIGLTNIGSRYALLTERKPIVENNGQLFIVKAPMI